MRCKPIRSDHLFVGTAVAVFWALWFCGYAMTPVCTDWRVARYGGAGRYSFKAICGGGGGDLVACGVSTEEDPGGDLFVLKADQAGSERWRLGTGEVGSAEEADRIIRTADGGYLVAGVARDRRLVLLRLERDGTLLWRRSHPLFEKEGTIVHVERVLALVQTTDGGFAVFGRGYEEDIPPQRRHNILLRLDRAGRRQWVRLFPFTLVHMCRAHESGFALTGSDRGAMHLVRLDADGMETWEARFEEPAESEFAQVSHDGRAVCPSRDGGFVVAGTRWYYDPWLELGDENLYVVKAGEDGERRWARLIGAGHAPFPGESNEDAAGIVPTADGGYVVAGRHVNGLAGGDSGRLLLAKVDADGIPVWNPPAGYVDTDLIEAPVGAGSLVQTRMSEYAVAGERDDSAVILRHTPETSPGVDLWLSTQAPSLPYYSSAFCTLTVVNNTGDIRHVRAALDIVAPDGGAHSRFPRSRALSVSPHDRTETVFRLPVCRELRPGIYGCRGYLDDGSGAGSVRSRSAYVEVLPPVSMTIGPEGVEVPPGGGPVAIDAELRNNTNRGQYVDLLTWAELPGGRRYPEAGYLSARGQSLGPSARATVTMVKDVPSLWLAGVGSFNAEIVWSVDGKRRTQRSRLEITKLPAVSFSLQPVNFDSHAGTAVFSWSGPGTIMRIDAVIANVSDQPLSFDLVTTLDRDLPRHGSVADRQGILKSRRIEIAPNSTHTEQITHVVNKYTPNRGHTYGGYLFIPEDAGSTPEWYAHDRFRFVIVEQ